MLSISSIAQDQVSIDLSNYKLSENTISYSDYSNESKQTIITFLDSIQLDLIVLDENLNRTNDTISFELPSAGYTIQKTIINDKSINYLIAKQDGNMSVLSYDRKDKQWNIGTNLNKDGERLIASFAYKNDFYIFNYDRKAEIIKSYAAGVNGLIPFEDYKLSEFKMGENNLSHFLKKKKKAFKVISNESPNELFASRKAKKVYQFKEKVYFSIDDSITNNTGLIQFDLKTKKHSISYFKNTIAPCDSNQFNKSALTENYLATISGCLEQAKINIWSLKTGKIIKSTSLVEKELITFKNYDNLISPNKAHSIEILKSQVLLRQLLAGSASIYLYEQPNNIELLVGRINIKQKKNKIKSNGGGGKGNGTGGGRQKKLDRLEKRKIKGLGLNKSFLNYEASKPQYFVANLNISENKFNTEAVYQNTFEAVKEFKIKNQLNGQKNHILFQIEDQFWFGYINNTTKKLDLHKFD
jgi:hypothetical protein